MASSTHLEEGLPTIQQGELRLLLGGRPLKLEEAKILKATDQELLQHISLQHKDGRELQLTMGSQTLSTCKTKTRNHPK